MSRRPEYCRFMPGKWRSATMFMTLEQEGLLMRISAFNMETGRALPDVTTAARVLQVQHHKLRKVLAELIAMGAITQDETGIYSPRAMLENERADTFAKGGKRGERSVNEPDSYPRVTPGLPQGYPDATPPVNEKKTKQILRAKIEERREEEKQQQPTEVEAARDSAAAKTEDCSGDQAGGEPQRIDYAALMVKLAAAAGPIMRLNCAGIHDTSPIVGCLRAGADLGLDVLPTIERLARTKPAGSVSSWAFFVDAIAKAKAARLSAETTIAKKPPKKLSFSEMAAKNEAWWAEQKRLIAEDEARHAIQH